MMFRRSDLPKLDNNLSVHHQNQFPLPPSMPPAHLGLGGHRGDRGGERDHSDPEDLRVPLSSPPFSYRKVLFSKDLASSSSIVFKEIIRLPLI